MKKNFKLSLLSILVTLSAANANAVQWVKTFDGSTTYGKTGTITLDDWGFVGPQGRQADSFEPFGGVFGNGTYDSMGLAYCVSNPADCEVGQRQHVVTTGPDGLTPDAPVTILDDWAPDTGDFDNANVDSLTTFFYWGYTSGAGSTFSDMLIDFKGNYRIDKSSMAFEFYNIMDYEQVIPEGGIRIGTTPDSDPDAIPPIIHHNSLAFQPYAVSDAIGWCGSILTSHPNAHEAMAGQVKFDIIMDVYFRDPDGLLSYSSSELTPDFEMRSFGDITLDFADGQHMSARAVVNNTDASVDNQTVGPDTPTGDIDTWHNKVSFMGSDMLETGSWCGIESAQWINGDRGVGINRYETVRRDITTQADCTAAGGVWASNTFVGFGYILRADAERFIDYVDESVYGQDPMTLDTDSDGVMDYADNCTIHANASQLDTDADGYGNICDADFNNDNIVNSLDIGLFKQMFFSTGNVEADLNGDGIVNVLDHGLFKERFFQVPGPSVIAN